MRTPCRSCRFSLCENVHNTKFKKHGERKRHPGPLDPTDVGGLHCRLTV